MVSFVIIVIVNLNNSARNKNWKLLFFSFTVLQTLRNCRSCSKPGLDEFHKIICQGKESKSFAIINALTKCINEHTCFLRVYDSNHLEIFFTTHTEAYQTFIFALGRSDYGHITILCPVELHSTEVSSPHSIWFYGSADWNGFHEFFFVFPLSPV